MVSSCLLSFLEQSSAQDTLPEKKTHFGRGHGRRGGTRSWPTRRDAAAAPPSVLPIVVDLLTALRSAAVLDG